MAISEFTIKRNDTAEPLVATLNDSNNTSFNLTGATVVFNMRSIKTGAIKIDRQAVVINDAAARIVQYNWTAINTDTSGEYIGEFEVTFSTGKIATFPNSIENMLLIHIPDDIH